MVTNSQDSGGKPDETVNIDKRVVIEILKTLEGIKRVLHTLLKK